MGAAQVIDWDLWSQQQGVIVRDIFGDAADELDNLGVRLRVGSQMHGLEETNEAKGIRLTPVRFNGDTDNLLELRFIATKMKGPPRYVIMLIVGGHRTIQALHALATINLELWERFFLQSGLWIGYGDDRLPFIDLGQVLERNEPGIAFEGVYLHSDSNRNCREGLMIIGTLYRSILDRLNDVSNFASLFSRLKMSFVYPPRYRGTIQP
jgi:hypothetical protein